MIYIEVLNRWWSPGKNLLKHSKEGFISMFEDFIAEEFVKSIKSSVLRGSRDPRWQPLSNSYSRYKNINGLNPNMWVATEELINSLYYDKTRRAITFPRTFHTKSNMYLLDLAITLEYGNTKIPARPLFLPTYNMFSKNIKRYLTYMLKGR